MKVIPTCAVSYLNTKPLLYGLVRSAIADQIDLQLAIPSKCAELLESRQSTLGLIPVAALPNIPNAQVVSNYCIGSVGEVATVCIYSDQPLKQLQEIKLDFHSRTSAALTQVLLKNYWKLSPELTLAEPGYIEQIGGDVGGLVIGDRTIGLEERFAYKHDLGKAWKDWTGLPFVFAVWVSTEPLSKDFLKEFNGALAAGVQAIPELTYIIPPPAAGFDLQRYFTQYISYELDENKRKGLEKFLGLIGVGEQALA